MAMSSSNKRSNLLEEYSRKKRSEVLLVHTQDDVVLVYKGVSSSLLKATALDLSDSVLDEENTTIKHIDRVRAPYNPSNTEYISQEMSWDDFLKLAQESSLDCA
ncbi:hypothetical protein SELMODRAFT_410994 [Selaginella moellendorffii]|uniref:DUF7734 domain-containing protein n=2 Tax=Selaginella moellendorffii TaxID=88036 RepID=D8RHN6_SELML|nr:uncharacterized protein LOC9653441 [Selaginella moellendorffii]EFJ20336.1 hypothetical protein SELMODRAFT_418162 [Selaginella moellendorffii]EFJ28313.1 hypothetical protein SELMODRAFT_410994 [Selaginella moellendorffii]|eukprot:XP_002978350.1 uncharacterized protein LOC9653441 [Selaginella moellendorffii]